MHNDLVVNSVKVHDIDNKHQHSTQSLQKHRKKKRASLNAK